jgi:invasion protein IalB
MNHLIVSVPARPVGRTLAMIAAALTLGVASAAYAQQPPAAAPAQQPAKPKPAPKPKAAAPAKPAEAPAAQPQQAPAPAQGQAPAPDQVQLIYSPWTKFCLKNEQDPKAKQVCFTGKDGRIESGMPVVAAVLIEPEGEPKKILRVTLPLGMQLQPGTRVYVDGDPPVNMPYVICFTNGCMSDYEVTPEVIGKMKKGQSLVVQGINSTAQPISLALPLADFAKAYDGPATDPKVFEEQQKKLQDELQRRADDARKKLEGQQGQPAQPGAQAQPAK